MKVDLSNLEAGDTVEVILDERDVGNLQDKEQNAAFWHAHQIVKHIPKPFDWKNVKYGDGLVFNEKTVWFIGHAKKGLSIISNVEPNSVISSGNLGVRDNFNLTHAPEHDIKVKS